MNTRRSLLKTMTAAGALAVWDAPVRYAFASVPTDRRLVVVVLRGALDGLAAVPPHGDKDYAAMRGALALDKTGPAGLHDLDGFFGLNPGLTNMKAMYDAKEVLLFHNICSPYQTRSHFDCQNVLESGGAKPHLVNDGWLNRALTPMGLATGTGAVAIDQTPPLLLSGPGKSDKLDAGRHAGTGYRVHPEGAAALRRRSGALRRALRRGRSAGAGQGGR